MSMARLAHKPVVWVAALALSAGLAVVGASLGDGQPAVLHATISSGAGTGPTLTEGFGNSGETIIGFGNNPAGSIHAGALPVILRSAAPRGDGDFEPPDDHVDLKDIAEFQNCFDPGQGRAPQSCRVFDFSGDRDVDLSDYPAFRCAVTGPLISPKHVPPSCP